MKRTLLILLPLLVLSAVVTSCGGDDGTLTELSGDPSDLGGDDASDDAGGTGVGGGDDAVADGGGGGDAGALEGEMATLRMVNLVGVADGGFDVDVVGPASDFSSDHVYGTVAYGEIAEVEFPAGWDARLYRAGTSEQVSSPSTVHSDTDPGEVVVFRDSGASPLGAYHEDRRDGYAPVGIASAIVDADPNRSWRWSTPDGVCLFTLGNEVPAPLATAAEGGQTSGILTLGLVDDFVWYAEPGAQTIAFADSAADVFSQGDDCSSVAFEVDIEPVENKAVFVAVYGTSDDVRSSVYYEQ